jgi:hypothetical protein
MLVHSLGLRSRRAFAHLVRVHEERKANAPNGLDCGAGQPTFVTAPGASGVDSRKGSLLRLSNISYSFNRFVLP